MSVCIITSVRRLPKLLASSVKCWKFCSALLLLHLFCFWCQTCWPVHRIFNYYVQFVVCLFGACNVLMVRCKMQLSRKRCGLAIQISKVSMLLVLSSNLYLFTFALPFGDLPNNSKHYLFKFTFLLFLYISYLRHNKHIRTPCVRK